MDYAISILFYKSASKFSGGKVVQENLVVLTGMDDTGAAGKISRPPQIYSICLLMKYWMDVDDTF